MHPGLEIKYRKRTQRTAFPTSLWLSTAAQNTQNKDTLKGVGTQNGIASSQHSTFDSFNIHAFFSDAGRLPKYPYESLINLCLSFDIAARANA
jgi:hypothetical protein